MSNLRPPSKPLLDEGFKTNLAIISLVILGVLAGWLRKILVPPEPASSRLIKFSYALLANTLYRLPHLESHWLIALTVLLYLLESYFCNTRRFLANSISGPTELEEYIEQLRQQEPVVTWVVRSYHYQKRKIFSLPELLRSLFRHMKREDDQQSFPTMMPPSRKCRPAFPFTKKVITNEATTFYSYQRSVHLPDNESDP